MKDKIMGFFLTIVMIGLMGLIGFLGYKIYHEIVGDGSLKFDFAEGVGYPTEQFGTTGIDKNASHIDSEYFTGIESTDNLSEEINQNTGKHLYKQLDDNSKLIYDKLYQNKENLKTGIYTIEFGNVFGKLLEQEGGTKKLQEQYQAAIEAFLYENPDVFYLDATNMYINIEKITKITGTKYNVFIDKGSKTTYLAEGFYTKEDVDRYQQQIEQERDKILLMVNGKSNYEKLKIIHDYLIENIEYDTTLLEDNIYNIYGALVSKKCVCEGYAKAYQYLVNAIGINNTIVIGIGTNSKNETENHAWNYVELDGKWYAVDTTWDDPIIIGGGKLTKDLKYQYFLKGQKTMSENHVTSGNFTEGGKIFEYPILSETDYK